MKFQKDFQVIILQFELSFDDRNRAPQIPVSSFDACVYVCAPSFGMGWGGPTTLFIPLLVVRKQDPAREELAFWSAWLI